MAGSRADDLNRSDALEVVLLMRPKGGSFPATTSCDSTLSFPPLEDSGLVGITAHSC